MLCKNPIYLKAAGGLVGCGQCFTCRLSTRRRWTFRLVMEALLHEQSCWISLTYNDDYLPRNYMDFRTGEVWENIDDPNFSTLSPRDITLFLKRLRKHLPPGSLRYFLAGEYGEQTFRPHYHLCLFGFDHEKFHLVRDAWCDPSTGASMGIANLDSPNINWDIAQYTCGYTVKKMTKTDDQRLGGRYPEFMRSSKGIGRDSIPRIVDALGGRSGLAFVKTMNDIPRAIQHNGRTVPIDRYMREKILASLNVSEICKAEGLAKFQKEMRSLSLRAELNPKFEAAQVISPAVLALQYNSENAQKVLNIETKAKLTSKKGDL